jgi:diadenosine tetraphosphate (Ap4A) HIT family hydrolase
MNNRFYDKENRYGDAFLKEYKHWIWEVSYRQHTLGSFIIFSKNSKIEKISELNEEEIIELKEVMKEIESILSKIDIFKPDRFNYWQMGNKLHHLHIHGFPRYAKPRIFDGREWIDKTWGKPPIWKTEDVDKDLVIKVRNVVKPYL